MKSVNFFTFLMFLPVSAVGQDRNAGFTHFAKQEYAAAFQEWRPLAEQGNGDAQIMLGHTYRDGLGLTQDYAEAIRWYELAAEQGIDTAHYFLGVMYENGQGVSQDYILAHMWYNISAEIGSKQARIHRDAMAEKMMLADISEAQTRARVCMASGYKDCN